MMKDNFTRVGNESKAADLMHRFLVTWTGRLRFRNKIRDLPKYLKYWGLKALKTIEMRTLRRKFLGELF